MTAAILIQCCLKGEGRDEPRREDPTRACTRTSSLLHRRWG